MTQLCKAERDWIDKLGEKLSYLRADEQTIAVLDMKGIFPEDILL